MLTYNRPSRWGYFYSEMQSMTNEREETKELDVFKWAYRYHGSNPNKGYTIFQVESQYPQRGETIAYLGDSPQMSEAVSAICEAHNQTIDRLIPKHISIASDRDKAECDYGIT